MAPSWQESLLQEACYKYMQTKKDFAWPQHTDQNEDLTSLCDEVFCNLASKNVLWGCGEPETKLASQLSLCIRHGNADHDLILERCDFLIARSTEKLHAFTPATVPTCWRELYVRACMLKFSALQCCSRWPHTTGMKRTESSLIDEQVKMIDMSVIMAGKSSDEQINNAITAALCILHYAHILTIQRNIPGIIENSRPSSSELEQDPPRSAKRQKLTADFEGEFEQLIQKPVPRDIEDRFEIKTPQFLVPPVSRSVGRKLALKFSYIDFENHMQSPVDDSVGPVPIIISRALKDLHAWPAIEHRPWKSPSYLLAMTLGGRRLVPVETGRSYVDQGWGQKIIPFKEFLNHYILSGKASEPGYLAQHELFKQIPGLMDDILTPIYCTAKTSPAHFSSPNAEDINSQKELGEPKMNAWFGPAGTISPLHTDPYHNILAQVVGRKYVRLYSPLESNKLYPKGTESGVNMSNTSEVDIGVLGGWDGTEDEREAAHKRFPDFKEAEYFDCILEEGECLYIPVGWWHYVKSLSVSFSVSFWWNNWAREHRATVSEGMEDDNDDDDDDDNYGDDAWC